MPLFGGGGEPCTLCKKRVYSAERVRTNAGNVYHKDCLRCTKCNKLLSPSNCCEDASTGRVYCQAHYTQMVQSAGGATGALDKDATVLVSKVKKKELVEELEPLGVGSLVWIDLTIDPSLVSEKLLPSEQPSSECYIQASITSADNPNTFTVRREPDGAMGIVPRKLCS